MKLYHQRPEVKERKRLYNQHPEVKERKRLYHQLYDQRPEVKERKRFLLSERVKRKIPLSPKMEKLFNLLREL